jgi:uncharacterized protein YdaU (DUF1376 family)
MESDQYVKSPAFQMYPKDFLSDPNTLMMSTAEIGAYCLLLFICWDQDGLPDDIEDLAKLARMDVNQFEHAWEKRIARCFQKREDGKWTHKRLEKERQKQREWRAKSARGGKAGAGKRKNRKELTDEKGGSVLVEPKANQRPTKGQPNGNTAFASSIKEIHASANAEERQPDPLFESLASLCRINWKVCTDAQRGALNQTCGILRKQGHTAEEVESVGQWWWRTDWRGKQGQAPTPAQIRDVWEQAMNPIVAVDEHPNAYRKGKMVY